MAPQREFVYIVYNRNEHGDLTVALACSRLESAEAAAQKMQDHGKPGVKVEQVTLIDAKIDLKDGEEKATTSKKGKENSVSDHDNAAGSKDDDVDGDETPPKPKNATKKAPSKKQEENKAARKVVPDGQAGSLDGLKLMFTGTMNLDRPTMEEAAVTYGGEIVKKIDESDWIVLGTKPGPKKLDEIEKKGLKTMNEQQFLDMLKGYAEPVQGPAKKKLRM